MTRVAALAVLAPLAAMVAVAGAEEPPAPEVVKNGMGPVCFLRFSPNGHDLVRICRFGGVEMFDTTDYESIRTFHLGMRMVAFSADGTRIATAEGTDGARVWDAALPGEPMPIETGSFYKGVRVLDVPLRVLEKPHVGKARSRDVVDRVYWTEFSPDGGHLVTTQASGHVKVWDTSTWTVEDDLALAASGVRTAAFAPDGKTVLFGDDDGVLHAWNFEKKAETKAPTGRVVLGIVVSPDGETVVTMHQSKTGPSVMIWGGALKTTEVKEGFASAAFSKDGKTLAFGGKRVELVDAASRKTLRVVELPEMTMREVNPAVAASLGDEAGPDADKRMPMLVTALAYSPDGATLAAGCQDGSIRRVKTVAGR